MKTRNKVLILTSVFILGFISSFNPILASSDINYAFESDVMYSNDATTYTEYNVREGSEFTGHYNATYSFENDIIGSVPEGWNNESEGDCSATVINELDGHSNVLNFTDNDISEVARLDNDFPIGIISNLGMDFWIQQDSVLANTEVSVVFYEGVNILNYLVFQTAQLSSRSWDIGWYALCPPATFVKDVWYHINLDFDDSANLFNLSLNGILYDNNDYSLNSTVGIDQVRIFTKTTNLNYAVYFDAIGYSWDGYNATYSFNSDVDGSNPSGWSVDESGGYVEVINEIDNHYKVVHLNDSVNGDIVSLTNFFSEVSEGTIELWLRLDKNYLYLEIMNSYSRVFWILFSSGQVYVDGGNFTGNAGTTQGFDVWFHCKLDFNHDLNLVKLYINGEHRIDTTFNVDLDVNKLFIYTHAVELTNGYVDGVGYSWDANYEIGDNLIHYSIGDNILPYRISNASLKEVDMFDFRYEALDDYSDVGDEDVNGWTDIDNANDFVNIAIDPNEATDFSYNFDPTGFGAGTYGIEKDFEIEHARFVNIYLDTYLQNFLEDGSHGFEVYSSDSTLIAQILINIELPYPNEEYDLVYYDGASNVELNDQVGAGVFIFDAYIDYSSDTLLLYFYKDGVLVDTYFFPLIATGKDGLEKVKVLSTIGGGTYGSEAWVDKIGVYVNDTTLSEEFAYLNSYYLNNPTWYFETYNLLTFYGRGTFSVNLVPTAYLPELTPVWELMALDSYSGEDVFYNCFDYTVVGDPFITLPTFLIVLYNHSAQFTNVSIEGIKLDDGTTEYSPTYNSGSVSNHDSYWWVENEELHYILNCDDNNTEFLQIIFNIADLTTYNNTFRYSAYNFNQYGRELRLNYLTGTTSIIDITYGHRVERVYFPPDELLITFDILITDDDYYDSYTGTGYFTGFTAQSSASHGINISTSNFLSALTPLLFFILIPSLLIIYTLDKQDVKDDTRERMFMPIFAVFCFVAYIFAQVDLWMVFIMIIAFIPLFLAGED